MANLQSGNTGKTPPSLHQSPPGTVPLTWRSRLEGAFSHKKENMLKKGNKFALSHPQSGLTCGSSFLYSKGFRIFQASLAICSHTNVIRKYIRMAPIEGATVIERIQMTILEVQEKLGTLLETLGLSNVCCRQATGISQAVRHKNTELHPITICIWSLFLLNWLTICRWYERAYRFTASLN